MVALSKLKSLVANGKIFSCVFIKRSDGQERRMIARTGVRKGVTGEGAAYDPESKGLLTVFDMEKKGFRMIPCEGVIKVTAQKQHHEFG